MKIIIRFSLLVLTLGTLQKCFAQGLNSFGNNISVQITWFNKVQEKNIKNTKLNIKLTNDSSINQQILFDKPKVSTGGAWGISARVTDESGKSIIKYSSKVFLSSQFYSEAMLARYYYALNPQQSISRQYKLSDIAIFNDEPLVKGTYTIQIFYNGHPSNKLYYHVR